MISERIQMLDCCFVYSVYYLHLSISLGFTLMHYCERAQGQFRCNIKRHRHTLPQCLSSGLHLTYAAYSQDASACRQLHCHPQAAGSEVIMRAGSICSLTPAVCLDYRNINRPGLTGSLLQTSHCLSTHSGLSG